MKARSHWNAEEVRYLRQHYEQFTDRQIAQYLDRSEQSVLKKRWQCGFTHARRIPKKQWTAHEDQILRREYPNRTLPEIAQIIGCKPTQCQARVAILRLSKRDQPPRTSAFLLMPV